jgi:hypothetical protein
MYDERERLKYEVRNAIPQYVNRRNNRRNNNGKEQW